MLKLRRALNCSVINGPSVDLGTVEQLFSIRKRIIDYKCPQYEQEDEAIFTDNIRKSDFVILMRNEEDSIKGFFNGRFDRYKFQGTDLFLFISNYAFIEKTARGGDTHVIEIMKQIGGHLLRNPHLRCYGYFSIFLPSYIGHKAMFKDCWIMADDPPPWEKGLFSQLIAEKEGDRYDPRRGSVDLPFRHREAEVRTPNRNSTRTAMENYIAANPNWAEGYALPVLGRFRLLDVMRAVYVRISGA